MTAKKFTILELIEKSCKAIWAVMTHPPHTFTFIVVFALTMCVDVSQLIVQVKQAPDAVLHGGDGSVSSQDISVELEVRRRVRPVQ